MNSLDPGVFTHTDGAPGPVSTSPLVPVPSFFLSFFLSPRPVGPRSPKRVPPWPPSCSYFFFSAAVSDTLVRLLTFHSPLILRFPPTLFFPFLSFFSPLLSIRFGHREHYRCLPRLLWQKKKRREEERKIGGRSRGDRHWEALVGRWTRGRLKKGRNRAENRTLPTKGPNNES